MKFEPDEFKLFVDKAKATREFPLVTITKSSTLHLNKKIVEEYMDNNDQWAELYYNEKKKLIGLKFLRDKKSHAYSLKRDRGLNFVSFSFRSFLKKYGIERDTTRRYIAKYDRDWHGIIIDLKETFKSAESK